MPGQGFTWPSANHGLTIAPNGTEALAISLWEKRENAEAYGRDAYPAVLTSLQMVVEGTPTVETYEVSNSTFHKIASKN